MIGKVLSTRGLGAEPDFRWRGEEPSRFEGVSDAVFAFSVTLLVVSLEVPKTFGELLEAMRGFLGFGLSFAMLAWIWFLHYRYFRRYGLNDGVTLLLGGALLFVVLFYVYPLKFLSNLFVVFISSLFGRQEDLSIIQNNQIPELMMIYGLGFAAVFGIFALLNLHAYRVREGLQLSPSEQIETRNDVASNLLNVAIGLLSVLVAWLGGPLGVWAGMVYLLEWPLQSWVGRHYGRLQRQASAAQEAGA